ncbi:MAG: hypothetical protein QOE08_1647 [Thermoleophilaceae bacterium]|nr:hypothetical protein [Thermoleophilaceae bacterium]
MNALRRIVAGDSFHRTRLHDEKGNFAGWREAARVPVRSVQAVRRRATGTLPDAPWYPPAAARRIEALLEPGWTLIEFGSGMSTPWYGRRVARLLSIELNTHWHGQITRLLEAEGLSNVRYERRPLTEAYYDLSDFADGSVDFVAVDGGDRYECVRAAIPKIRPGGWLYLDNSDMDYGRRYAGAVRPPEPLVLDAATHHEYFIGLPPGIVSTTEGLLARL